MAYIYARTQAKACQQCKNFVEEEHECFYQYFFPTLVKGNRKKIHTYDCAGFEPQDIIKSFTIYPRI